MKFWHYVLTIIIVLILGFFAHFVYTKIAIERFTNNKSGIVHLIYIPWDRETQKLKDNPTDFDHSSYNKLKAKNSSWDVILWTLPLCQSFVKQYYPKYEKNIFNVSRPVMSVDILRFLILFHYGGIYWQYGSKQLVSMNEFLPNKNVKLFTETIITDKFANDMKTMPIRSGIPEENLRVMNQIFSAKPRHSYLWKLFETAIENSRVYKITRDYDILYTTGNAMMSTVYDQVGKYESDIELIDIEKRDKMIKIHGSKSWNTDKVSEKKK